MSDEPKEPKTLADWELEGMHRFKWGDKIPYPTRDTHSAEEEKAFTKGFVKAQKLAALDKQGTFDGD